MGGEKKEVASSRGEEDGGGGVQGSTGSMLRAGEQSVDKGSGGGTTDTLRFIGDDFNGLLAALELVIRVGVEGRLSFGIGSRQQNIG
jgi:hypothetical protein